MGQRSSGGVDSELVVAGNSEDSKVSSLGYEKRESVSIGVDDMPEAAEGEQEGKKGSLVRATRQ